MRIEYGCSRTVLLIGNLAFKFPTIAYRWRNFLNGLLHNMQEVSFSQLHEDNRLCPVIFHLPGGFMTVMPRCRPVTEEEYGDLGVYPKFRKESIFTVEDKHTSFGWLNGRVVAIDYGD